MKGVMIALVAVAIVSAGIGATIAISFLTGHYLDLALPLVDRLYGTMEDVPIAYDRGFKLAGLSGIAFVGSIAGMIWLRIRRRP
jgi:hypothetical protein